MTVMRKTVKKASDHRDVDMFDPMCNLALQFMFLLISDLSRLCEEMILKRLPMSNKVEPQSTSTYEVIFIDQRQYVRVELDVTLFHSSILLEV